MDENIQKVVRTQLSRGECLDFVNGKENSEIGVVCVQRATVANELVYFFQRVARRLGAGLTFEMRAMCSVRLP